MSYATRLTPETSLTMREEMRVSSSYGSFAQSAVIASLDSTARRITGRAYVRSSPITPTDLMSGSTAKYCQTLCSELRSPVSLSTLTLKREKQINLLITVRNSEVIQCGFESILSCKTRIKKIAVLLIPLREPSIIERLHVVSNNERNNVMSKAFFKHDQSADTSIAVLKWMNALKANVIINNVFKGMRAV